MDPSVYFAVIVWPGGGGGGGWGWGVALGTGLSLKIMRTVEQNTEKYLNLNENHLIKLLMLELIKITYKDSATVVLDRYVHIGSARQ